MEFEKKVIILKVIFVRRWSFLILPIGLDKIHCKTCFKVTLQKLDSKNVLKDDKKKNGFLDLKMDLRYEKGLTKNNNRKNLIQNIFQQYFKKRGFDELKILTFAP